MKKKIKIIRAYTKSEQNQLLEQFGIINLPKPIMEMSLQEIRKYFGYATTSGIKIAILMRNLIWQIYCQIQAGNPPDFYKKHGYIRGMWYYIKPKFQKHHPLRGDRYQTMVRELTRMVKAGLFDYIDFNFRDRDADTWQLGFENPHIILATEKDGFVTVMEELYKLYGCHTITLGGIPSYMTINYMVARMKKFGIDLNQKFHIITITDFDPSGYNVADELCNHLKFSGVRNFHEYKQWKKKRTWLELVTPENIDKPIKDVWYTLPKKTWDNKSTKEWIKLTGGLDGTSWKPGKKTHGIESDEFSFDLLLKLVEKALSPILQTPSDHVKKLNSMKNIQQEIEDMLIIKFLDELQGDKQWQKKLLQENLRLKNL